MSCIVAWRCRGSMSD